MGRGPGCSAVLVGVLLWAFSALAEGGSAPLGAACTLSTDCDDTSNVCLRPVSRPSGVPIWVDGYCTRACSTDSPCAAGSLCVQEATGTFCLKQCASGGECRSSYVCDALSTGDAACQSSCGNDTDCAPGFACRLCDGQCIARQTPGALIGDPCTTDPQCGTGQECLHVNGHPQGVCSQACGDRGCFSDCPEGSTCQSVGSDRSVSILRCMRTCSAGSCGSQLQCADFPQGAHGCLPPCRRAQDCPTPSVCGQGLCQSDGAVDAGCPSCGGSSDGGSSDGNPSDAGSTPAPLPTPPPVAGGVSCGCQQTAVNAPGFLGALGLLFVAARRRLCPRP